VAEGGAEPQVGDSDHDRAASPASQANQAGEPTASPGPSADFGSESDVPIKEVKDERPAR
jgi:hypothetical protein